MQEVLEPDNLRLAFIKAKRGKQHKAAVRAYAKNLEKNLERLRQGLREESFPIGNYHFFTIFDPKERQICAADFSERVMHHALMNVCHTDFERYQTADSYASRKGKGTYAALDRAKQYTEYYSWYAKLDVRKYFYSIPHSKLEAQLRRLYKDEMLLRIFNKIIKSYTGIAPCLGLPIGNLTSQYFANHYLAAADHFVKEQIKSKAYIRYMDDMVFWHQDKAVLLKMVKQHKAFIEEKLSLHLKPPIVQSVRKGLPFLGYRLLPHKILLLRHSARRFKQRLKSYYEMYSRGQWTEEEYQRRLQPLFAFTSYAQSKGYRKKCLQDIGLWT